MKTVISFLLLAFVVAGCQKPDAQVAKLESRISDLESNVTELYARNENRRIQYSNCIDYMKTTEVAMEGISTNLDRMDFQVTMAAVEYKINASEITDIRTIITNLSRTISGRAKFPPFASTPANPWRIPDDIEAQIKTDAANRFPNDYDEQAYIIKEQEDAWHKLNP